ncbi:MAG TPA: threonine/serine exporter family protein [Romboutsia timonensis]|uniref:Threonine/serine exporter family protein n=1 Tax=Romboutsia timonensis TaxID=1776391 RepID=A0A921T000_9FIRM|nr:threonine/serine exporter family protein [uncultured Romboutsia sp.]HJG97149.1 threonine/serine exporter family protein [Romboutsia timonensis]
MTDMPVYMHFLYSTIATIGFSVFLNAPKSALIPAGLTGGIGWSVYYFLIHTTNNDILANFLASILVALISEILARKLKYPAILFVIPGIIPLVPGLGMYNTMLYLVQSNYELAISKGANVLFIGGAISLGVLAVTSLSRTLNIVSLAKIHKNK